MIENYDTLETDITKLRNPVQPLYKTDSGVVRFKPNTIIDYLFNSGALDLNKIAAMPFTQDDREQLAQLLGYSLSGFGTLSYVTDETYSLAAMQSSTTEENDRNAILRKQLKDFKNEARLALSTLTELLDNDHG